MITITIKDEIKRELLSIAADLQKRYGRKVSYNEVLEYLISKYKENIKNIDLFKQFCNPPKEKVNFEDIYRELRNERLRDG